MVLSLVEKSLERERLKMRNRKKFWSRTGRDGIK